jgi:hypothetical protein
LLKSRQIGFIKIHIAYLEIDAMPGMFRTRMNSKMFAVATTFRIFIIRSLQPLDKRDSHPAGKKRILTIGFLSPSPSWIPEDIDIGGPESKPVIDVPFAGFQNS